MMQVSGSTSNIMQSRAAVAGVGGKNRKVRQAKASTIEATQPMRSAWVRSDRMRKLATLCKAPLRVFSHCSRALSEELVPAVL
jgi:hypothetical protein